jgi:hypothetical protein
VIALKPIRAVEVKAERNRSEMEENKPEDATPPQGATQEDLGRPKRSPPTIELEASERSESTESGESASAGTRSRRSFGWPFSSFPKPLAKAIAANIVGAVTGAVTALLVVAIAWLMGWPGEPVSTIPNAQTDANAIATLTSRLDDLEARSAKPANPASDPAILARLDALEKSLGSMRAEIGSVRAQSDKVAGDLSAVKSESRNAASSDDLAAIGDRLNAIERANRVESAELAQAAKKPADDTALRRVVAASMLDISVRQAEPFAAALTAAKALAPNPDELKPLETFAASGVPSPASLCRELLTLVPKLSPPAQEKATTGTGIMDRLQAGAAKLVRIERTDATGNDRSAIVARITAAALRNDLAEARRELNSLAPNDRAAAQAWLDKANERDAALASSHRFASQAMAALEKQAQ